jgi:Protein of unknown function (DUF3054)
MTSAEETNNAPPTEGKKDQAPLADTQRIATLVVGDALAFLVFAAIGRGSHGEATGLAAIPQIVLTALPFAAGWFIVAPFAGAYRRELTADPRKMAIRTVLAWVLAWPVAMALRGLFVDHAVPPISFAIIALLFNTAILLIWRWPYALNNSIKKRI